MYGDVVVNGIVEYTPIELECLAEEYLRRRVDVCLRLPIDVELLLERTPNVRLRTEHCLKSIHHVEGCVCNQFMSKQITVLVDYNIANSGTDADYNAVISEELAHIVIHKALIQQVEDVQDFLALRQHPNWYRIEQDAAYFSGAIRMPPKFLEEEAKSAYKFLIGEHGFTSQDNMIRLVRNCIADRFDVPLIDARRRMEQCSTLALSDRIAASLSNRSDKLVQEQAYYGETAPSRFLES